MCGSSKYPYSPMEGHWKFQGEGVARGMGVRRVRHFQRVCKSFHLHLSFTNTTPFLYYIVQGNKKTTFLKIRNSSTEGGTKIPPGNENPRGWGSKIFKKPSILELHNLRIKTIFILFCIQYFCNFFFFRLV